MSEPIEVELTRTRGENDPLGDFTVPSALLDVIADYVIGCLNRSLAAAAV
jgi:hypothetical protein